MSLLPVREVARRTSISTPTLYRHIRNGELPAYRIKRRVMVDEWDLQRWLDEHRVGAALSNGNGNTSGSIGQHAPEPPESGRGARFQKHTDRPMSDFDRRVMEELQKIGEWVAR